MRIRPILNLLLFMSITGHAWALDQDATQPIFIQADFAKIDNQQGIGYYEGRVQFDQGTSHIRADRAQTQLNEDHELIEAIAYGNQQHRAYFWTQPEGDQTVLHAKADTIRFVAASKRIYLIGNAEITKADDVYRAPKIEYDSEHQTITSPASKQGRTEIIIHHQSAP